MCVSVALKNPPKNNKEKLTLNDQNKYRKILAYRLESLILSYSGASITPTDMTTSQSQSLNRLFFFLMEIDDLILKYI